jgi:hypothetical protein
MRKIGFRLLGALLIVYVSICGYMFFYQEDFIFLPEKMEPNEPLMLTVPHEEVFFYSSGAKLNGFYANVEHPRGLIFFLHGNKGNLNDQDQAARFYTSLGYDFFSFDYRGYGKSSGHISSEEQFFNDVKTAYAYCLKKYDEKEITIIGYSLGTGPASYLASVVKAPKLLLIAPYYSLKKMTVHRYKVIPTFLVKYPFDTYLHMEQARQKKLIVHGDLDAVLPFEAGRELSNHFGKGDRFVKLPGQGHDDMEKNQLFRKTVRQFLGVN